MFEGLVTPVGAATMSIDQIALGKTIDVNGQKFVKVRSDAGKGSQFQALKAACLPNTTPYFTGTMQEFTAETCNNLPAPSGTCYVYVGTLQDARDGKSYEVRKFSDGKCWMVDNLMYGGSTDACASKTTFSGNGSTIPTNIFGTGTYGDCRNNPGTNYGYLYNWQAAMQHASAYLGASYTGPTTNVQGICPTGWHLPTGNTTGEYQALYTAVNSNVAFWQASGSWKEVFSGYCNSAGGLINQSSDGNYWSSTQSSTTRAYYLYFNTSVGVHPASISYKFFGFPVRCIKN